jgi:TrmH family RNA methyltransferase
MLITSPANERLKYARRVRDGREPGLIFVEGERLAEDCLQTNLPLSVCFHAPEPSTRARAILEKIAQRNCLSFAVTETLLAAISDTVNTQGVILIAQRPSATLDEVLSRNDEAGLIVCLDGIQDPGNFGTIVRTAEAAGASGVVALKGSVDAFAPKTLRSAMGSAFRLPITADVKPEQLLLKARAAGLKILATTMQAETAYSDFDWRQPAVIVFGNEANGVREELLERCDGRLKIPLRAPVGSLNVAAAAAVILFEAARQQAR